MYWAFHFRSGLIKSSIKEKESLTFLTTWHSVVPSAVVAVFLD